MAENTGQEETPPVKPNDDKPKMAGKEKAIKGTRPDPTKKILLMEWNKRLDPNARDTYSEIDIDMEDDIDGMQITRLTFDILLFVICDKILNFKRWGFFKIIFQLLTLSMFIFVK